MMMYSNQVPKVNILGVGVSAINMQMATATIDNWIQRGESHYVCVTGVHGLIESQRENGIRQIHNQASLVTPDGMPLVWISRFLGFSHVGRVYGPDLMLALCELSVNKGYRHFLYGGSPGVPDQLAENLTRRFPGLAIVGIYSPPYRPLSESEEVNIRNKINSTNPDIVWVGLSTPKQERWMAKNVGLLSGAVIIGVGAAFDFHAGFKSQAPFWMQNAGLEWLFRLVSEPRRLWKRYLFNNPLFVCLLLAQALGIKRYSIDL